MNELLDLDAAVGKTSDIERNKEIVELLRTGTPTIEERAPSKQVVIYVDPDDSEEIKDAKDNIQFVVNTAKEAIDFLMTVAKATGNPRFFEAINSYLNTISGATDKLIGIHRRKTEPRKDETPVGNTTNIQNNITQVMSTSDALKNLEDIPLPKRMISG